MKKRRLSKFEKGQVLRQSKALASIANKFRKELIANQTEAEKKFKNYLRLLRIRFEFQKIIYAGKSFFIVDFYLPRYGLVIEIDGGYHKEQVQEDNERSVSLLLVGIRGIWRFSNKEVFNDFVCVNDIRKLVNR